MPLLNQQITLPVCYRVASFISMDTVIKLYTHTLSRSISKMYNTHLTHNMDLAKMLAINIY